MRIIALMNQKGGVGKTTTTANLGAALAKLGKRVCLIDMDPQAHLTINYGVEPARDMPSLYGILLEDLPVSDAIRQLDENVWIIPSSIDLAAADIELVSVIGRETLLKKKIEESGLSFDYVLLDCPPSLGLLTVNALAAATEVVIPLQPHFLALQGVGKLLETVSLIARLLNPRLKVLGMLLTLYDSQAKLSAEIAGDLKSFIDGAKGKSLPWSEARIFNTRIRRNIKLAESPSFGQTIFKYEPSSNGAADYLALARELVELTSPTSADAAGAHNAPPAAIAKSPATQATSAIGPAGPISSAGASPAE